MKKTVVVIILLIVGLIVWLVKDKLIREQGGGQSKQGQSTAVAVIVQPVRRETVRDIRSFTGTVSPNSQFLVAPKVAGRLERLLVNLGQEVKNGDLIALLDNQEYSRQVEQARAELEVAKANVSEFRSALDIAAKELERVKELRKQQVASESEMDQADARFSASRAKYEVALAQVKQREAALKADEVRLSYTRIHAVWENGNATRVIGERYVDEGAMLRANDPIVSVLDLSAVIAAVFVIELDYPHIQVGQSAVITTDAFPSKTFPGKVVRKAPLIKESSRQARVEIEVANPKNLLVPGMFVRAELQFATREDAVVVPESAIVRRNGRKGVFMADVEMLKVRFVPVTVGITIGEMAEILDPILEGQVVTLGQHLLNDGADIILPAAKPTGSGQSAKGRP
ncbi:MAG: efflux RND transporter periplasmic adaptor subunit [Lentisphaerae bacterium]|nr:efflux RND transporter periplasmic adaptor subunit [Lentisphaerota bacterium]